MNPTTRIAVLSFLCGGLSFSLAAPLVAPLFAPPLRTSPPLSWQRKTDGFRALGRNEKLVFLGDSRIEEGAWSELLRRGEVSNRGISGDTTAWMLERLPVSVPNRADAVVVQLGVNDLMRGESVTATATRMEKILDYLRQKSPKIVFTSVIAVASSQVELNGKIAALNRELRVLVAQKKGVWVDSNAALAPDGPLEARYSNDGLHLNGRGYQVLVAAIKKYL